MLSAWRTYTRNLDYGAQILARRQLTTKFLIDWIHLLYTECTIVEYLWTIYTTIRTSNIYTIAHKLEIASCIFLGRPRDLRCSNYAGQDRNRKSTIACA